MDGDCSTIRKKFRSFLEKIEEGFDASQRLALTRSKRIMVDAADSEPHCELANGEAKRCGFATTFGTTFKAIGAKLFRKSNLYGELHPVYPRAGQHDRRAHRGGAD